MQGTAPLVLMHWEVWSVWAAWGHWRGTQGSGSLPTRVSLVSQPVRPCLCYFLNIIPAPFQLCFPPYSTGQEEGLQGGQRHLVMEGLHGTWLALRRRGQPAKGTLSRKFPPGLWQPSHHLGEGGAGGRLLSTQSPLLIPHSSQPRMPRPSAS